MPKGLEKKDQIWLYLPSGSPDKDPWRCLVMSLSPGTTPVAKGWSHLSRWVL